MPPPSDLAYPAQRDMLPRVYELRDSLREPGNANAYFQNFERTLATVTDARRQWCRIESVLARLPDGEWQDLKKRATPLLTVREEGRGWSPLFRTLAEAWAFAYLLDQGCTNVRFVRQRKTRSPDLEAQRNGRQVLCEVKYLGISDVEAGRRGLVAAGDIVANTESSVPETFLQKIRSTIASATAQIDAMDPDRSARRLVFAIVEFDDWVGDYQVEYLRQVDDYLAQHQEASVDLIVCPYKHLFPQRLLAMRTARVIDSML